MGKAVFHADDRVDQDHKIRAEVGIGGIGDKSFVEMGT